MAKTIVGLYEDRSTATRVVSALMAAGFSNEHVQFASSETGGPGEFESDAATFRSPDALTRYGVDQDEATFYAEGLRRGGSLVVVRTQDADADAAVDIMAEHNPVRYEDRASEYTDYDASAPTYTAGEMQAERSRYAEQGQQRLQEIQESIEVGKREVVRGAVRVATRVESEEVSETIRLREEAVRVNRTEVDRELTPAEADAAFREKSVEVVAHAEEPVVQKTAHVTGEVTVGLETNEREETVGGTVRSTHVDVEEMGASAGTDDEAHFRDAYGQSGRSFDTMRPAYDYGRQARSTYADGDFASNEHRMRSDYEGRYGNADGSTWDDVKDAVRHGYHRAHNAVS
jgi:stress response protein YsnF